MVNNEINHLNNELNDTNHKEKTSDVVSDSHQNTHLEHAISLPAEPVIQINGLEISNALLTTWLVVLIIAIISILIKINLKTQLFL